MALRRPDCAPPSGGVQRRIGSLQESLLLPAETWVATPILIGGCLWQTFSPGKHGLPPAAQALSEFLGAHTVGFGR